MLKEKIYDVGNRIGDKWIIVSTLKRSGTNTKIICYNTKNGMFKEGWLQDFVRDNISDTPNRHFICKLCEFNFSGTSRTDLYDFNSDHAFNQAIKSKNLTSDDIVILRNIREGLCCNVNKILKKFSNMIAKSGQHRRNIGLSIVIGTTYEILYRKGII